MERAAARPADQWGGHLRRARDKGQDGERAAVLAVRGVVSVGGREAHLPLEGKVRVIKWLGDREKKKGCNYFLTPAEQLGASVATRATSRPTDNLIG